MMWLWAKLIAAYLLGSISGSLVLGRFRGVDIRELGSGNAGGTNALRTQGWGFAIGVVAIDVAKGAIAASLGYLPGGEPTTTLTQALVCGLAAAIGHVWPVWHGFRGGKGAATLMAAQLVVLPASIVPPLLVWIVVLGVTGYVGLATVLAAATLPVAVLLFATGATWKPLLLYACAYAGLILFTHRANLVRVRAGTELRFEGARFLARWLGIDGTR
ncbi:MAG TPA: glycerol-3-phosphate acyltransferase [Xanthomonadales bacterium]|nr:glycerol-3-phosphate acyltransferase [Xanthomonadales bacterium]